MKRNPIAFIDCETSGLDSRKHEMLDFSAVFSPEDALRFNLFDRAYLTPFGKYVYYTTRITMEHPENAEPEALKINGYDPKVWKKSHPFAKVAPDIRNLLHDCVLAGHVVAFDVGFLEAGFERCGLETRRFGRHRIDTAALAYEHLAHTAIPNLKLATICTLFGISNEGEHGSLVDSIRAREAFLKLHRATWIDRMIWAMRAKKLFPGK